MKAGAFIHTRQLAERALFSGKVAGTVLSAGVSSFSVCAQPASELALASSFVVSPRVSVSETYTNNVFLRSAGRQAELITQVSPGIRISSHGGRISGAVDYSLSELVYANGSSGRRSQNSLNANLTTEVVDKWAYLDFRGVVGQQAISAFGAPASIGGTALSGNSTETSVFQLSPYVRGRLGDLANYVARYSLTSSKSKSGLVSDVASNDVSLQLTGIGGRAGSGWSVAASHQSVDFNSGRSTQAQRINGQVSYPFTASLGGYVSASHESNNYGAASSQQDTFAALGVNWTPNEETRVSIDRNSNGSTGLVVNWAPSRRTNVSITRETRLYGETHSVALAYRTASTAWTFNDSRSAVSGPGQSLAGSSASLYDLLSAQFAAGEKDPAKREQYDLYLQANGIRPGATAVGGFLTSAVSLQRLQQLSFALFGERSTVSVTATRSSNTRLDTASAALDDLSNSPVVQQNGLSLNYSYRLTARSVVSVAAAVQKSSGSSAQIGTSSKSVNVNLSTQLSKDTSANVSARHVVFESSTAPYTETAVIGNLSVQF